MKPKRREDNEASFEGILDLGSIPPPTTGPSSDVHAASTAVAELPKALLEELRRVRPVGPVERRKLESSTEAAPFIDEAPTAPGKERALAPTPAEPGNIAPRDLLAAVNEALAAAGSASLVREEIGTQPTRAVPKFVSPPEAGADTAEERPETRPSPEVGVPRPRRRWRKLLLALAAFALAIASAFAARRVLGRRNWPVRG